MATIPKGTSYKKQDVYVAAAFPQKGESKQGAKLTGYNVILGIANDRREPEGVITDPMLVYNPYTDPQTGEHKTSFTQMYSKEQYEAIMDKANKDGDRPVVTADLMPSSKGRGLVINTKTLETPAVPFDDAAHKANTEAARETKRVAREAAAKAEAEVEAQVEAGADVELDV